MPRLETDLKIRDQDKALQHKFETETKSTKNWSQDLDHCFFPIVMQYNF